jgi:cytochrome c553
VDRFRCGCGLLTPKLLTIGIMISMKKTLIVLGAGLALATLSASAADVKETWEKACAKCHGMDGKGDTKMGQKVGVKDMTDAKRQEELKDEAAFKAIKEGIKDADGKIKMKAAEDLTDDEIKALVAFVRKFKK